MSIEVLIPSPVVDAIVEYLNDRYEDFDSDATAHTMVPDPRPDEFVTVKRTGGFQKDRVIFDATLQFEAWGTDDDSASDLADLTYGLVHALRGRENDVVFYRVVDIGGPGNLPDPESDQSRFVFTLSVSSRAIAL